MILQSKQELQQLFAFISKHDTLCIDIETTGLNPRTDKVMGIGISSVNEAFYLPCYVYNPETDALSPTDFGHAHIAFVLQALKQKKLLAYNGAFDLPFLRNQYGVDLVPHLHCDVMLLKHTCDENPPFALKEVVTKIFSNVNVKAEQEEMKESVRQNGGTAKQYYKASMDLLAKYCKQDCLLTFALYDHYSQMLHDEGLENFFYRDEVMPLYREVTIPMEQHGIRLNVPLMQERRAKITADIQQLEDQIQAAIEPHMPVFKGWFLGNRYKPSRSGEFLQAFIRYHNLPLPITPAGRYSFAAKHVAQLPDGYHKDVIESRAYIKHDEILPIQELLWAQEGIRYMFNLNSKHHLKKLFFGILKEQPDNRTPTGQPQADEDFLARMARKYPWAELLRVYNKLVKIKGTYIERFLAEQEDGLFYPSFQQHRTISGRYGSDLQQLPRPLEPDSEHPLVVEHTNVLKEFFVADEGYVFVDADYESLEPHVFAHVSGDERIKNIFRQGLDFYSEIAIRTERLEGVSSDKKAPNYLGKVNKAKRQRAKSYSLGIPYGMSGYKLAFELNVETEQAEALVQDYLRAFPDLAKWMQDTAHTVRTTGKIRSQAGRIRHMPQAKSNYERYGLQLEDSLELWKAYHSTPVVYDRMKELRRTQRNYLNNGNNFQIQSLAASIVNRAAIALNRAYKAAGLDALVIAQIHDELITKCPASQVEAVVEIKKKIMENNFSLSVQLKAEPTTGMNFKEAKG